MNGQADNIDNKCNTVESIIGMQPDLAEEYQKLKKELSPFFTTDGFDHDKVRRYNYLMGIRAELLQAKLN